jgi:hypothetical protein
VMVRSVSSSRITARKNKMTWKIIKNKNMEKWQWSRFHGVSLSQILF